MRPVSIATILSGIITITLSVLFLNNKIANIHSMMVSLGMTLVFSGISQIQNGKQAYRLANRIAGWFCIIVGIGIWVEAFAISVLM
jgi:hypothetical protein